MRCERLNPLVIRKSPLTTPVRKPLAGLLCLDYLALTFSSHCFPRLRYLNELLTFRGIAGVVRQFKALGGVLAVLDCLFQLSPVKRKALQGFRPRGATPRWPKQGARAPAEPRLKFVPRAEYCVQSDPIGFCKNLRPV